MNTSPLYMDPFEASQHSTSIAINHVHCVSLLKYMYSNQGSELRPIRSPMRLVFSVECTIGMVWGLTALKHYGTMAITCKL